MYSEKEVNAAKKMRDAIISDGTPQMKAIYIVGEIVMWDEMQVKNLKQAGVIKSVCGDCWGSGWETQLIQPCRKCNGTGKC
jgi:hypothetical protein